MKMRYAILLAVAAGVSARAQDPAADPVVQAIQKTLPAVVNISTEHLVERFTRDPFEDLFREFFGAPRGGGTSLGSGVIVDQDGWLITNYHVIRRASRIQVTLADGKQYEAKFVSGDERNDLALLKIEAEGPLTFLDLASDREPLLGETVIAIGNPFGFDHTVTKGIISAKNRKWPPDSPMFDDILQTDAAINPGNSGGPLINTRGELVGINTAVAAADGRGMIKAEGIGFAIPAQRVANLLGAWLSPEKRARLWLGVRFAREGGRLLVAAVQPESPASQAGVRAQDVIVEVDGQRFAGLVPLQRYLLHRKAGEVVKFAVERDGQRLELPVRLTALPKLSAEDLLLRKFGLAVQPMTRELAGALGIAPVRGLLIADVQRGSPAAEAGLRRGMVITQVGAEELESLERLAEQLGDVKAGDWVSLGLFISERRGGFTLQQTATVTLKAR